jgi:hypothetical protein
MNVRPLEYHEPHVPPASAKEAANRFCVIVVLCKPPFEGHGKGTGTETGCEADTPKTINRNRKTSGFVGDGWVGYDRQVWVTTVQQLVKEQGRLLLIIWLQVIEGPDE